MIYKTEGTVAIGKLIDRNHKFSYDYPSAQLPYSHELLIIITANLVSLHAALHCFIFKVFLELSF